MATIWKSTNPSSKTNQSNKGSNSTFAGAILSSWSRQQKLAMIAGFAILGLLLAVSACSKQASKPALVSVSDPVSTSPAAPAFAPPATASAVVPVVPGDGNDKDKGEENTQQASRGCHV